MRTQRDIHLAQLAAAQHGVVSRRDLETCGLTPRAIVERVRAGRLHRIHRGVYAVGHTALGGHGRLLAAALACGPDAVLSHTTAASVWGLRATAAAKIHVTVRSTAGRSGPAIVRLHRRAGLRDQDRTNLGALPVTTVARTLLDLAAMVSRRVLDRALEQAEILELLDARTIATLVAAEWGRPGAPALEAAMAAYAPEPTRSPLEDDFLALAAAHDLPRPMVNTIVQGFEVDAYWPDASLVAELDSRRFHRTTLAFERDRERDAMLVAAGYKVLRFTHRRIRHQPEWVAARVRRVLSASRSAPGTGPLPSANQSAQGSNRPFHRR